MGPKRFMLPKLSRLSFTGHRLFARFITPQHLCLVPIVSIFVVFATLFAFLTPPLESPDEPGHLNYINFFSETGQLSNQYSSERFVVGEGYQYPLYYVLTGLLLRAVLEDNRIDIEMKPNEAGRSGPKFLHQSDGIFPDDSDRYAFYGLRLMSVVLGTMNVIVLYLIASIVIADNRFRIIATAIAATLPQYQFISGSLNNDNLANLLISVTILFLLKLIATPRVSSFVALGFVFGLAFLTKKTSLFMIPVVVVVFCYLLISQPRMRGRIAVNIMAALGSMLVLSVPLLVRNYRLYDDPLGSSMERTTMPSLVDTKPLWTSYWFDQLLPGLFDSFVGHFGWLAVKLPSWVYDFYLAMILIAVVGLVCGALRQRVGVPIWLSPIIVGACFAGIVVYNLTYTQYQGRFLFPVLSLICVLLALGFQWLLAPAMRFATVTRIAGVLFVMFLVVIDLVGIIALFRFYYRIEQHM